MYREVQKTGIHQLTPTVYANNRTTIPAMVFIRHTVVIYKRARI